MWRFIGAGIAIIAVVVFGFSLIDGGGEDVSADAVFGGSAEVDLSAYAQAIAPWDWQFPRDFGAHPDFQTEWWYYTGNVATEEGRRFGFQFTVFRRAIAAQQAVSDDSEWRTRQIYMAHFTVSDIENEAFYHEERYSRSSAGLAGALPVYGEPETYDEPYRVWLEDWEISTVDENLYRIDAQSGDFAIDLTLEQVKPPALQGDDGLSPKSEIEGNASYYYTLSRLLTDGTITIGGEAFEVSGRTWKDHEFSTSALGERALGWDWFGLIFDDERELMVGQIRLTEGGIEPAFGGLMIYPDGETRYLDAEDFTIEATDSWESPATGAVYPLDWVISIEADALRQDDDFVIDVTPLMRAQELNSGDIAYWEGAVEISGDATGYGYAELTGYVQEMTGRF